MKNLYNLKFITILLISVFLVCTINAQTVTPICLSEKTDYENPNSANSLAVGDFDNDGYIDFVSSIIYGCTDYINLGSAVNNFTPINLSNGSGNCTFFGQVMTKIKAVDVDNNGVLEIVSLNNNTEQINIQISNGAGYYHPAQNIYLGINNFPFDVAFADFDKNNYKDFVYTNTYNNSISVINTYSTGFTITNTYSVGVNPFGVITVDVNNDGNEDVIVTNANSSNISVLLGSITGTFSNANNFSVGNNPKDLTAADFNGDTKIDLAIANYGSSNFNVMLGNGFGGFTSDSIYFSGTNPASIKNADFNNDGFKDIVIAHEGSNDFSIYLNKGNGKFILGIIKNTGNANTEIDFSDLNSDGKIDLVVANGGLQNSVYYNYNVPAISASTSSSLLCVGQTATITASGANTYTWNSNAQTTSIAISPSITTNYTVTGTSTLGCASNAIITQSVSICTGIDMMPEILEGRLNVYPNPTNGILNINSSLVINEIIIKNTLGEVVYQSTASNTTQSAINIRQLQSGVYFLELSGINQQIIKIIKTE